MQKCINASYISFVLLARARALRAPKILENVNDDNSEISESSSDEEEENAGLRERMSDSSSSSDSYSDSDDEPLCNLSKSKSQWKQTKTFHPKVIEYQNSADDGEDRAEWKEMDYMRQYIDRALFILMSACTNVTSVAVHGRNLKTSAAEIEQFIGFCLFMSCVGYPRIRLFWKKGFAIPLLSETMTRDRFFRIRSSLKAVIDIDVPVEERKSDRLWKVRPVINRVRKGCLAQARTSDVSIDEQMIPFTGACDLRQYVPNKPNPVGLKNFVAASPDGLVLDFIVYQGSTTFKAAASELKLGIGGNVIAHLSDTMLSGTNIYCDRYFTSPNLIDFMLSKSIYVTGTVMKNRIPEAVTKLSSDKELQKRGRGASDIFVRQDTKMAMVKWFDNKPIVMLSAIHGKQPEDDCRRWSKKDKAYIIVKRPAIIREYNNKMGGVDLCDRMIALYRMKTRTKKWTIRTILHFVDLAVVNAWIQYRKDQMTKLVARKDILQFLDFKLSVARAYLAAKECGSVVHLANEPSESQSASEDQSATRKRPRLSVAVPASPQRTSAGNHLPEMTHVKNAMRCRKSDCTAKSKVRCVTCKIYLCMTSERNCFIMFHKK